MVVDPNRVDYPWQVKNGPASLPPSGPAGGDLSGIYPDPTVVGLQGHPVAVTTPSTGDTLIWSGSVWAPGPGSGIASLSQVNPTLGPFGGSTLTVDHSRGLLASTGPALTIELASYTQAGVIGTAGNQQIKGTLWVAKGSPAAPVSWSSQPALVVQNGGLAFVNDAESSAGGPHASIAYGVYPAGALQMAGGGNLNIFSSLEHPGYLQVLNADSGNVLNLGPAGAGSFLDSFTSLRMGINAGQYYAFITQNPTPSVYPAFFFDLQGTTGTPLQPGCFSVNGTHGVKGTMLDGSVVLGGIITSIGSTHAGGPPTGAAGGDLTGSYPNPTIAKLQSITLSAGSPTSGDVLTYSGGVWQPLPIAAQTLLTQASGLVEVDASGNVEVSPASAKGLGFFGATPVAQQDAFFTTTGFTANSSGNPVDVASTFTGGTGGTAFTIGDIVLALKKFGLFHL